MTRMVLVIFILVVLVAAALVAARVQSPERRFFPGDVEPLPVVVVRHG